MLREPTSRDFPVRGPLNDETQLLPPQKDVDVSWATNKTNRKPYQPGLIMRWFGNCVAILFSLFCLGIISITFGFILTKYYSHLFH